VIEPGGINQLVAILHVKKEARHSSLQPFEKGNTQPPKTVPASERIGQKRLESRFCEWSFWCGELIYAGKVDRGFDNASVKDLQARLKPLIRKTQPYAKKIAHRGFWVEPSLLAEIEYRAKSAAGNVRHPFFKGIREDL
jgi:ATP-dependent DNA ligase